VWCNGPLIYEASHSLSKRYAQVQEVQLRQKADTTDWRAYMKRLEREERALGVGSDHPTAKARSAKTDSSQARK
jgi:hypothetical protein